MMYKLEVAGNFFEGKSIVMFKFNRDLNFVQKKSTNISHFETVTVTFKFHESKTFRD